ncbi:hypothetical protein FACS189419_04080 [Planctomycetales bacterium]|nr:hypothetical protein FACS189419_04080 [Planctomycetales bacterium]
MRYRAFTLIEVLIVLGLMTTLLLLISTASNIFLRRMTIDRTEVEEAQLARSVLNLIAADIRNVVNQIREEQIEIDTESLAAALGLTGFEDELASELSATGSGTSEETGETAEEEEEIIYGQRPGIYGDLNWIQIDTAKLPRGDMYASRQVRHSFSPLSDRLSASKTVMYYLGDDTQQLSEGEVPTAKTGLICRQLDRQVTQYAVNEGEDARNEEYDEAFVPEAYNIEFAYFDPSSKQSGMSGEWLEYWDMDEMQMLPAAVQITLTLRRRSFGQSLFSFGENGGGNDVVVYSLVVPIPVSIEIPQEESEETSSDSTGSAASP